jgi:rhodanese-related sulfurtransferase
MRNFFFIVSLFFISTQVLGQNPDGFDKMCNRYIKGTVETVQPIDLKKSIEAQKNIIILDAREQNEYNVSHIQGAKFIGYDNFDLSTLPSISKDTKIYVYCSIGYRSEKIGEKLMDAGYKNVYNLYGGIFSWTNHGFPVVSAKNMATHAVHGYNKSWSKWIDTNKSEVILK